MFLLIQNLLDSTYTRNEGKSTDFELISGNRLIFKVHLVVFRSSILLENENSFIIEDFALDEILLYCYLSEVRLSANNIKSRAKIIWQLHELQIKALKSICGDFLDVTFLDSENRLRYAWLAEQNMN